MCLHTYSVPPFFRQAFTLAPLHAPCLRIAGGVAEIMRTNERGVLTCSPGDTLESIIPSLTQVTGMPVINDAGRLVGVISRKVGRLAFRLLFWSLLLLHWLCKTAPAHCLQPTLHDVHNGSRVVIQVSDSTLLLRSSEPSCGHFWRFFMHDDLGRPSPRACSPPAHLIDDLHSSLARMAALMFFRPWHATQMRHLDPQMSMTELTVLLWGCYTCRTSSGSAKQEAA